MSCLTSELIQEAINIRFKRETLETKETLMNNYRSVRKSLRKINDDNYREKMLKTMAACYVAIQDLDKEN